MAIKLKREELPRYAACIKLEEFISKKIRKITQKRLRRMLEATFLPNDLDLDSLVKVRSSKNARNFSIYADKLTDLITEASSPKQTPFPSPIGLSMSGFTESVLSHFLQCEIATKEVEPVEFKEDPLYLKLVSILQSKLTGKIKIIYGKPISKEALVAMLHSFVTALKRNGSCFFGSEDLALPLGLALRTPTYLSTIICVNTLLKHGHIKLDTE